MHLHLSSADLSPLPSDTGLGNPLGNLLSKVACERVHAPFSPGAVWGNLQSDLPIVQLIYLCLKSFLPLSLTHLSFALRKLSAKMPMDTLLQIHQR